MIRCSEFEVDRELLWIHIYEVSASTETLQKSSLDIKMPLEGFWALPEKSFCHRVRRRQFLGHRKTAR